MRSNVSKKSNYENSSLGFAQSRCRVARSVDDATRLNSALHQLPDGGNTFLLAPRHAARVFTVSTFAGHYALA